MGVRFGEFRLDTRARQLFHDEAEVHLSPKAFDLLARLVEARPAALSKSELMAHLWPETFVSDANLSVLIGEIRNALGDPSARPRFIRTVHRFGYAFSGPATSVATSSETTTDLPVRWLAAGSRKVRLLDGENVVGRDPTVQVWCDQTGISRRHARIVVAHGEVTVEDLQSKNGTYVNGNRIVEPTRLRPDDEIKFASLSFTFRVASTALSTETEDVSDAAKPSS